MSRIGREISNSINQIELWISENRSKNWMCKKFGCRPSTLDRNLIKNGIFYSGNRGERGYKRAPNKAKASEYLGTDKIIQSSKLRKKLISDGIKKEECEYCGNSEWMGQKIPLDLHHIDGVRFNNNLSNLQILCKNCHGLTENHSKIKEL